MSLVLAISEGALFGIGAVVFIAVFTAGLGLAYARFEELGADDEQEEQRRSRERDSRKA
jgi:hypothetical protein